MAVAGAERVGDAGTDADKPYSLWTYQDEASAGQYTVVSRFHLIVWVMCYSDTTL